MYKYPLIIHYRHTLLQLFNNHWIYFFFLIFLTCTNPTIHWDATPQALILHLYFFKCFVFFKFNVPNQKSDMINSTRIIFVKIIIKINIIRIYIKNTHFISVKCNITIIFIKIEYIFICI